MQQVANLSGNLKIAAGFISPLEVEVVWAVSRCRCQYFNSRKDREQGDFGRIPARLLELMEHLPDYIHSPGHTDPTADGYDKIDASTEQSGDAPEEDEEDEVEENTDSRGEEVEDNRDHEGTGDEE